MHTRKGSCTKLSDLRKVAAESASTIILMQPEGMTQSTAGDACCLPAVAAAGGAAATDVRSTVVLKHECLASAPAEAFKASASMSLIALGTTQPQQRVVVQMPGELPIGGNIMTSVSRTMMETGAARSRECHVLQLPDLKVLNR